ncbi:hypothetical protein OsI_16666 [Oryza sativa Indica Group]|uniref:Uncharacterized protein n=1 Tax=Oryza sativa subsp. indica TaxID=39946 RepID=A2XVK7_ORYSI|nr:hypothetical protein OsI_16666 [Oryza sativa Indica Group]
MAPKNPKGNRVAVHLSPYELERLKECMKNSARLKELGLPDRYTPVLEGYVGVHSDQNQSGDSESEYDPLKDDTGEGDLIDDENAKQCSKEKTRKNCNNKTSSIQTGGVKFRSRKRVYAEQMTPKVTRSKKSIAQQDASLTPSDIYGFTQHDDNTLVADVVDGITQHGDHNQITNEVKDLCCSCLSKWKT